MSTIPSGSPQGDPRGKFFLRSYVDLLEVDKCGVRDGVGSVGTRLVTVSSHDLGPVKTGWAPGRFPFETRSGGATQPV